MQKIQKYVAGPLRAPPGTITTIVKKFKYRYDPSNSKGRSSKSTSARRREDAVIHTTNMDNDRSVATSTSVNGAAICHAVPCHISYTGPSSGIDIFFNPIEIRTDGTHVAETNDESNSSETANESKSSFQAAMIRGRGLLARSNDETNVVCGHVFQVATEASPRTTTMNHRGSNNKDTQPQKYLQSIQTFDRYVEWYHEHQTSMIPSPIDTNTRYNRAMEWINIAACLHDPLPIPIDASKDSSK